MQDVLFLLSLCVEDRARRIGLYGNGVSLKLTYPDMKGITRSRSVFSSDSAITIYQEAVRLLNQLERRSVRLIGTGIYHLSGEEGRQLYLDGYFERSRSEQEKERRGLLDALRERYHLDFAGHLTQIYQPDTLHKTVEYMRKHMPITADIPE